MKKTISILAFSLSLLWFTPAVAETYVNGYTKSNGTYVQGHYRSSPNSSRWDNYSSKGNSNPYTGKKATRRIIVFMVDTVINENHIENINHTVLLHNSFANF